MKAAIEAMRRRRSGPDDLPVFREDGAWRDVRSEDVNAYLRANAGDGFSAKDFRTTPAVCRSSYIDPRVLDRFRDGKTIELPNLAAEEAVTPRKQGLIERRVLGLIE